MMCGSNGWPHCLQFPSSSSKASGTGTIYHALDGVRPSPRPPPSTEHFSNCRLRLSSTTLITSIAAVWSDWRLTWKGASYGLTVAVLIMALATGTLFLSLGGFLPGSAITRLSFQGFTAHAAYLKSESYFLILAIALLALPFHFVICVQREIQAGRPDVARALLSRNGTSLFTPAIIYPRPSVLLALLIVAGLWSLFSVAHLFEHLLPSPHMGRYMNLLQIQRLMYFALGFECLAWYHISLGRLQRSLLC